MARLFKTVCRVLVAGGAFVVDNSHRHPQSKYGGAMEMNTRYHSDRELEQALERIGLVIESRRETANRVNVVYTARKAH